MNIGKTLESLNSLINKKQRKRISRHSKFMKQQKRTLVKTLKQDKVYRQQLENYQEEMFNSTLTRSNKKNKRTKTPFDVRNNMLADGDTSFQSISSNYPVRESTNVTIIISKLVIEPPKQPDDGMESRSNLSASAKRLPQCSVALDDLEINATLQEDHLIARRIANVREQQNETS